MEIRPCEQVSRPFEYDNKNMRAIINTVREGNNYIGNKVQGSKVQRSALKGLEVQRSALKGLEVQRSGFRGLETRNGER